MRYEDCEAVPLVEDAPGQLATRGRLSHAVAASAAAVATLLALACAAAAVAGVGAGAGPRGGTAAPTSGPGAEAATRSLQAERPHVVLIVVDDLGHGDLSPWAGNATAIRTPTIDRLAADGVVLDRYYTQVRCTPSRAALLTGRYPLRYGLQSNVLWPIRPYGLPANETTMAQLFQQAGYATHAVGKWHLGFHTWNATPSFRGFDSWVGISEGESDHWDYTIEWGRGANAPHYGDLFRQRRPQCGEDCTEPIAKQFQGTYSTVLFSGEAVRIVNDHNVTRPLFLYLAYTAPHSPCQNPPEQYVLPYYSTIADPQRRTFAAMVSAVDGGIQNVTNALRAKGMLEDTILVVSTDNGAPTAYPGEVAKWPGPVRCEPLGHYGQDNGGTNYPLRGGKGSPYEGGALTPALIHYPRFLKRRGNKTMRFAGLAHISDWFPTLATAAGIKDHANRSAFPLDGVDLWKALQSQGTSPRTEVLVDLDANGVNTGGALIRNFTKVFVGGPFKKNYYGMPPEVAQADGVQAEEVPKEVSAIDCWRGCVVDLSADPGEEHPSNDTRGVQELLKEFQTYNESASPSLFYVVPKDKSAGKLYASLGHLWPYINANDR